VTARWKIEAKLYGTVYKDGTQSFDRTVTSPRGVITTHTYQANLEEAIKRLRHNIADNFWFHRKRARFMKEMAE
jgi:hypothetical protein